MGGVVAEVAKDLPPQCIPFDKLCFSCAGDQAFLSEVQRSGRRQILLCGVESHICVCQTALDLHLVGFQVHVASDAVSSRSERSCKVGLRKMEQSGILISSAETAIYEMLYEAGTPEFREILSLIKSADDTARQTSSAPPEPHQPARPPGAPQLVVTQE